MVFDSSYAAVSAGHPPIGTSHIALLLWIIPASALILFNIGLHCKCRLALKQYRASEEDAARKTCILQRSHRRIQAAYRFILGISQHDGRKRLAEKAAAGLVDEFGFPRSQIWLSEAPDARMVLTAWAGEPPVELKMASTGSQTGIHQDQSPDAACFGQAPLFIVDTDSSAADLPQSGRKLVEQLGARALASTPLRQDGRSIGFILVDIPRGRSSAITGVTHLNEEDGILLESLARPLADALSQAELYAQLEQAIESQTIEVQETQRRLLLARRMAVQNEKLSGLGQLAAGVAHEINNPLNLLFNMVPELRKDYEALEAIHARVRPKLIGDASVQADKLAHERELEAHLEEKDFVFPHMASALEKSRRNAGSLKFFSRSSARESVAAEPLSELLNEVLTMLPQKSRINTQFHNAVPENLYALVNRIELEQVMVSLVQNAIDSMGKGGRLEVRGLRQGDRAELHFVDNGPGVSGRVKAKIFAPFFTTKPGRVGLGLTMALEILKKYQGSLELVDTPKGLGAEFVLSLPATESPAAPGKAFR